MSIKNQKEKPEKEVSPSNIGAEQSLLACLTLDSNLVPLALEKISEASFYVPRHRIIFQAIIDLLDKGQPTDIVTLTDKLKNTQQLNLVGGAVYLTEILNFLPTTSHFESYLNIVAEKYLLRTTISGCNKIIELCKEVDPKADTILDKVESQIFQLAQKGKNVQQVTGTELMRINLGEIEARQLSDNKSFGLTTGYADLDHRLTGFKPGDMIILAGRPSSGKSALALNLSSHILLHLKKKVGFLSLEMSKEAMGERLLAIAGKVNYRSIQQGQLTTSDWDRVVQIASQIANPNFIIDDTAVMSPIEVRAKARAIKTKYDIDFLILDYLQLLSSSEKSLRSRQEQVAEISRSLKSLAKELKIPIMILCQLNRECESRPGKKPRLSDLRDSGGIEQDADIVVLIMRPAMYSDHPEYTTNKCYVEIAKHRNGATGELKLAYLADFLRFENYLEESAPVDWAERRENLI